MKLRYFIPALMAICAMFTGCSDKDEAIYLDGLRVSSSYVAISTSGTPTQITLTAGDNWQISGMPDWLNVSPANGGAGEQTVTFSADAAEGRTAALKVTCGSMTQEINVIQGIAQVAKATCAEVIAGADSKTYLVTGTCVGIANTNYGNWYLDDGTGQIYIYGTVDASGKYNWASFGIEVGDEVTVQGPKTTYNGTVELVDVSVVKVNKSLIKVDSLRTSDGLKSDGLIPQQGGEITAQLTCKANGVAVEVPAEAQSWLSIVNITAGAAPAVTFRASENSGPDRSAKIVFKTNDGKKDYTAEATFTQAGLAKGNGTDSDPYNVAAAIGYARSLGADVNSEQDVYVKGIISSVKYEYSAQFGTATYNISDDGTENGVFTVYSGMYFGGAAWQEGDEQIKVGDEVIVAGKVVNYKGTTPEFVSKQSQLVSLNGKRAFTEVSVAEFKAAAVDDTYYNLTGVVMELYGSDKQGKSFYIKDFSGETLVYRTEGFLDSGIKVGDVVSVTGKRGEYKETPQMVSGSCMLVQAVTPVTIAEFLTKADDKNTWYMVTGTIKSLLGSNGKENDYGNLYLTDGTNELYVYGTYPGWGATGDFRKFFIADNGLKEGDEITIIGYKDTYNGLVELCQGVCFSFKKAE